MFPVRSFLDEGLIRLGGNFCHIMNLLAWGKQRLLVLNLLGNLISINYILSKALEGLRLACWHSHNKIETGKSMADLLQEGIKAYRAGKRDEARKYFAAAVKQNQNDERIWQWMYNVCNNDIERIRCLKQILRINPKNEKANRFFAELTAASHLTEQSLIPSVNLEAQLRTKQKLEPIPIAKTGPTNTAQKTHDPKQQKNLQIGIVALIFLCFICICVAVFEYNGGGGGTPTLTLTPTSILIPNRSLNTPNILSTPTNSNGNNCNPSYPTVCINNNPHLNCTELKAKGISNFKALPPDPLGYDRDGDGIGCDK